MGNYLQVTNPPSKRSGLVCRNCLKFPEYVTSNTHNIVAKQMKKVKQNYLIPLRLLHSSREETWAEFC